MTEWDSHWIRFLQARSQREEEQVLFEIVRSVLPTIRKAISRELARWQWALLQDGSVHPEDPNDICAEAIARLIGQMRALREQGNPARIQNILHYAAGIAQNTVHTVMRRNHPAFRILYDRIMYVLYGRYRNYGFAVWNGPLPGERVVGLRTWYGRPPEESDRYGEWRSHPDRLAARWAMFPDPPTIARFFTHLFEWLNHPIRLTDLLSGCARIWAPQIVASGAPSWSVQDLPDVEQESGRKMDYIKFFQDVIREIRSLPLRQRRALLWHWSGTDWCIIAAYAGCGLLEFADILEVEEEELYRIYPHLPLPDRVIAERLGVTQQQVINLRKSALERLRRRLRPADSITRW